MFQTVFIESDSTRSLYRQGIFRRREASIYVPMSVGRSVGRLVGLQKILKNKKDEVSRVI